MVWGNTSKGLPWSSIQAGSQTTYAHTRANYATGMDLKKKLQEVAAKTKGGSPEGYDTGPQGVIRKGGGLVMTWTQAAEAAIKLGGIYDGTETPKEINAMTKAAAAAHKGRGLMGVARDNLPRDGQTYGFMSAFAEVEVDVETGVWTIVDFVGVADVGTGFIRTRWARRSMAAVSGYRAHPQPETGLRSALAARACPAHAPEQAAVDHRRAVSMRSGAPWAFRIRPTRSAHQGHRYPHNGGSGRRVSPHWPTRSATNNHPAHAVQPEHILTALAKERPDS